MKISIDSKIAITNPNEGVLNYIRYNLIINNPDYQKKTRLGFWVGNTPQKIHLYEKVDGVYYLPYGCVEQIVQLKDADEKITPLFAESPDVDYKCNVPLYDYQEIAVDAMYNAKFGILQSPAGSGKTQMGIALMAKYGKRALWITHTHDLLKQSFNRAAKYMDENLLGTITEGMVDIGGAITFATIQTLSKIDLKQYRDYWDVIICDECHRVAGAATTLTMYYKVLSELSARHKYGLSATVHRSDGMIRSTYALLGQVKYTVPEESVEGRVLAVGIKAVGTGIGVSEECLNDDGTLNYTSLITYLTECKARNRLIAQTISDNKDYSCLILSDRVAHLEEIMSLLPDDLKEKAVLIHGKMQSKKAKAEREQAIEDMRTGDKKFLFATYSLAKEGLDVPRLERLFMTTPQKDYAVVTQSIGRIARTFDGKANPICYDFVDNMGYTLKAYKKRWTSYRKAKCYEVKDD